MNILNIIYLCKTNSSDSIIIKKNKQTTFFFYILISFSFLLSFFIINSKKENHFLSSSEGQAIITKNFYTYAPLNNKTCKPKTMASNHHREREKKNIL